MSRKHRGACLDAAEFGVWSARHAWSIAAGNLSLLSEQQLVDCDVVDSSCNGELMHNAFFAKETEVAKESATCTEVSYSYIATHAFRQ